MVTLIIQILLCIFVGSLLALTLSFGLMKILNPTATDKEILDFWINNFRKNRNEGRLF